MVQTPSSTPMPTAVAALQTSHPATLVHVHRADVGLADAQVTPRLHRLDAAGGIGLDPAAGGDPDLHAGHLGPDGGDRVADEHRIERLLLMRVARVHVHRRDPQPGDVARIAGEMSREHRQGGVRIGRT